MNLKDMTVWALLTDDKLNQLFANEDDARAALAKQLKILSEEAPGVKVRVEGWRIS